MKNYAKALLGVALTIAIQPVATLAQEGEVNIYSYREPGLIQPLLDQFTAETGIKTNVLSAENGLIERIEAEGELSPADVLLTVDIGNLVSAKKAGITQAISDETLDRLPPAFRDEDGMWAALSLRARIFYASKDRVSETEIDYEDIAGPEWKGRLCTRAGDHPYNIGLIANRIAAWGEEKTADWLEKVRDNLVSAPSGNDRAQVKSIFSGECDLAIGNTYYMGLMLNNDSEPEQKDWAASVNTIYPDTSGSGTQVNGAGVVLAKYAPNLENANLLIEFLLSDEAQQMYANTNYEYPAVSGVAPSELVQSWGTLNASDVPLGEMAELSGAAATLVEQTRFNEGPQN